MRTGEGLAASASVQRLQTALHAKAKEAPGFRFYSLSDKAWRDDVLTVAWQAVRRNGGAAVAASLKRFGWQQAIVADPKGVIVAGETRYKAAVLIGLTAAPVVTIPARQARAFRVIDNRTSELTSWDTDLLPDALSGLSDLDIFSFDDVLPRAVTAGKTDPDDIPETPKKPRLSSRGHLDTREAPPDVRGRHEARACRAPPGRRQARPDGDGPALRCELRRHVAVHNRNRLDRASRLENLRTTTTTPTGRQRIGFSQVQSPTSGWQALPCQRNKIRPGGGGKLDHLAAGPVSESGWAAGLERSLGTPVGGPRRSGSPVAQPAAQQGGGVRTRERQRRGGLSCCVGADSCRRSVPGCGRDGSAGRAARRSAVQSQRSRSIR